MTKHWWFATEALLLLDISLLTKPRRTSKGARVQWRDTHHTKHWCQATYTSWNWNFQRSNPKQLLLWLSFSSENCGIRTDRKVPSFCRTRQLKDAIDNNFQGSAHGLYNDWSHCRKHEQSAARTEFLELYTKWFDSNMWLVKFRL